ncbi:MAG: nuclear transport factor 2 family protein [Chloroflexota bacterium]|nr:nuclear transport factor 2 family protein [Chloroflexota bacterium]
MTPTIHEQQTQCAHIYDAWHERARAGDVEGLLALYASDATLETPLIPVILDDTERGVLHGHAELRRFFAEGTRRRPNDLVRWYRTGTALCDGRTLFWEYPREMPDGEQVDIAEVMEIEDGLIVSHRIYWGWFGFAMLQYSRDAKRGNTA